MLAIEYALKYQEHLRGLVISNMAAGIQACLKRLAAIKGWLPPEVRERLHVLDEKQDYDNPEYDKILVKEVYPMIMCRTKPRPESVVRSERKYNVKIYSQMWGKNDFVVTGNLKNWERWDRLHEIKVRALTIGAQYDAMYPEDMRRMAKLMPNATNAFCPNGSHLCMWDDQEVYFRHLVGFLSTV
jgi:proline iminopeptidase